MVRRTTRWKAPPTKVLSTPESKRVVRCYAIEGAAYIHHPMHGERCTIILLNEAREILIVRQSASFGGWYDSDEVPLGDWRVLGWIPAGGELRHGELDAVDPDLADFAKLPRPNSQAAATHKTPASQSAPPPEIDIVPWDADGKPEY